MFDDTLANIAATVVGSLVLLYFMLRNRCSQYDSVQSRARAVPHSRDYHGDHVDSDGDDD